jgi:hypothetical protein
MNDRLNEALERLEAIERRLDALERDRDPKAPVECGFLREEQRIVDLIVRLVTEAVDRGLEDRTAHERSLAHPPPRAMHEPPRPPAPPPPPARAPGEPPDRDAHPPRRQHPRRGGG